MKSTAIKYSVTTAIGLLFALAIMGFKGVFTQSDARAVMQILCDSFFVSGVCLACVGLIIVASNGGAFDMLAYAVIMIFDALRRDIKKRKYKDFYEYRQAKKEKKRNIGFILIVGIVLIAVSMCFLIAYYNVG